MKEVYSNPDYTRVGFGESMLKEAGIACFIRNANIALPIVGFSAEQTLPTLCITADEEWDRAQEILSPLLQDGKPQEEAASEWICPFCGEAVPGEFQSCWKCGALHPNLAGIAREQTEPSSSPSWGDLDKRYLWHPFTPMSAWCAPEHEPMVITQAKGCELFDDKGNKYLDGNSSIWTNIHGHNHPRIKEAIRAQLEELEHTSFLGTTHPAAIQLGQELVGQFPEGTLSKVFFSDNGSTAVESALRMALQYWSQNGRPERDLILAFDSAYHGDTLGAASLGGISLFKGSANHFGYAVKRISSAMDLVKLSPEEERRVAAVIIEPLMQGAAGMRVWPKGMLRQIAEWRKQKDTFLILDEVMTAFGRTGTLFACEQEEVIPDFLCCAKGITGGYLPLAATLTTQRVFDGFLGDPSEGRTFYYGHSYTANPLGCAAALASLAIFREENVLEKLAGKIEAFTGLLATLESLSHVKEIRQCGFIAGIELVADKSAQTSYAPHLLTGAKVCREARHHGLLTRPIGDTLVLMPPLSVTQDELTRMVTALRKAIVEICGS